MPTIRMVRNRTPELGRLLTAVRQACGWAMTDAHILMLTDLRDTINRRIGRHYRERVVNAAGLGASRGKRGGSQRKGA